MAKVAKPMVTATDTPPGSAGRPDHDLSWSRRILIRPVQAFWTSQLVEVTCAVSSANVSVWNLRPVPKDVQEVPYGPYSDGLFFVA